MKHIKKMIWRYYISYNKSWKLIIDKGIDKTQLRQMTGMTANILAKLGKNEYLSTICFS